MPRNSHYGVFKNSEKLRVYKNPTIGLYNEDSYLQYFPIEGVVDLRNCNPQKLTDLDQNARYILHLPMMTAVVALSSTSATVAIFNIVNSTDVILLGSIIGQDPNYQLGEVCEIYSAENFVDIPITAISFGLTKFAQGKWDRNAVQQLQCSVEVDAGKMSQEDYDTIIATDIVAVTGSDGCSGHVDNPLSGFTDELEYLFKDEGSSRRLRWNPPYCNAKVNAADYQKDTSKATANLSFILG